MRIVSKAELRKMPVGTLYTEYHGRHWPDGPDADGWRGTTGRRFDEPVDYGEFIRRSSRCTLASLSSLSGQVLFMSVLEHSDLDPAKAAALRELARTYRPDADAELAAAKHEAALVIAKAWDVPPSIVGLERGTVGPGS